MLKHYFNSIIRNNKLNTFIRILGLGLSFSLVIYLAGYVYSELSFDKNIKDNNRIYRAYMNGVIKSRPINFAVTSPNLSGLIKNDIPEIEQTVRVQPIGSPQLKINESLLEGKSIIRTDQNFFSFFGFNLLATKSELPLDNPSNVVISESLANKFFSSPELALNQVIKIKEGEKYVDYFVAAVFEDLKHNFQLDFQIVQSVYINKDFDPITSEFIYTYIKTKTPLPDFESINLKMTQSLYYHNYGDEDAYEYTSLDQISDEETYIFIFAESLLDIHFSKHKFESAITSNKTYVYGSIILAFLVVLISFINYFNLSLATLSKRFKNFGIRKTIGASKADIAITFTRETIFFFVIVFVFSLLLYAVLDDPFTKFTEFKIRLNNQNLIFLMALAGLAMLILIALSNYISYKIITRQSSQELIRRADKGNITQFKKTQNFFIVVQYALASFVIVATLLVNKQIQYFATANKGFDSQNILTFQLDYGNYNSWGSFINELKNNPLIRDVALSSNPVGSDPGMNACYFDAISEDNYFHSSVIAANDGYPSVYDLQLVEGRFFDESITTDYNEVLINESAAKEYMLETPLVGNNIYFGDGSDTPLKVVGIVKDFNFRTLHYPIEPLVIKREKLLNNIAVKINNEQIKEAISFITGMRSQFSFDGEFRYAFLDENLAKNYYQESQFRRLLIFMSLLAIFISCLGLFAISQLTVINKTKEIAIRKINGASISSILTMLNMDFVKWVLLAFMISTPFAWFAITKWLENFAYKTSLSWWVFLLAGSLSLFISIVTVSWQCWRAASSNPVKALRNE